MKIQNKLIIMLCSVLALCLTGCSEDENIPGIEPTQELLLETESIKIKIGSENKTVLNIQQGGGEYNAFSLDENIATAHSENGKVFIEGHINGKTAVVVSDKNGYYRKINVWSYTTDSRISLSTKEIKLKSLLGYNCSATADILEGNGFYTVACDNEKIKVTLSKTGQINISGVSKRDEVTATVTISDWFGLSETINVTLSAQVEPFTAEELTKIKADSKTRYIYNKVNSISIYYPIEDINFINKDENGKIIYGWKYPDYGFNFEISYTGDRTVGEKEKDTLSCQFFANDENGEVGGYWKNQPINVEIIKNDGTNIWAIYDYIRNEKLNYGYFCDTIEPKMESDIK